MTRYSGDPYWIRCRYAGKCAKCGAVIHKGAEAFRYKNRSLFGRECGCGLAAERDFQGLAHDEAVYNGEPWYADTGW